jgi:hypothetical protein
MLGLGAMADQIFLVWRKMHAEQSHNRTTRARPKTESSGGQPAHRQVERLFPVTEEGGI